MNEKKARFPFNNRGDVSASRLFDTFNIFGMDKSADSFSLPGSKSKKDEAIAHGVTEDLTAQKVADKNKRSALFKTAGGSAGEEILSGGVKKRDTIFGNA